MYLLCIEGAEKQFTPVLVTKNLDKIFEWYRARNVFTQEQEKEVIGGLFPDGLIYKKYVYLDNCYKLYAVIAVEEI